MKAFALASLLPFLAAAGPVKRDQQVPPFTVTAVRSGSDIQYLSLEARGGKFWLGGDPGTYCPLTSGSCPPSTETVISGVNALDVEVPGGQLIYVLPTGELGFTQGHSAYIPAGAATGPFEYIHDQPYDSWYFTGFNSDGFLACPTSDNNGTQWQVFADIPNFQAPNGNTDDCLGFQTIATTYNGDGPAAWEYI